MGLDIYLTDGGVELFDGEKDPRYPDHLCGPTYLRSSYNPHGFDHRVRDLTGKTLNWVFGLERKHGYEIHMTHKKLGECRERAVQLLEELKQCPPLACEVVYDVIGSSETTESGAIRKYIEAAAEDKLEYADKGKPVQAHWYMNRDGHFYLNEPLKVLAAIPGVNIINQPCLHLIYESSLEWYIQMADIVVAFIDKALTLGKPVLLWSC